MLLLDCPKAIKFFLASGLSLPLSIYACCSSSLHSAVKGLAQCFLEHSQRWSFLQTQLFQLNRPRNLSLSSQGECCRHQPHSDPTLNLFQWFLFSIHVVAYASNVKYKLGWVTVLGDSVKLRYMTCIALPMCPNSSIFTEKAIRLFMNSVFLVNVTVLIKQAKKPKRGSVLCGGKGSGHSTKAGRVQ